MLRLYKFPFESVSIIDSLCTQECPTLRISRSLIAQSSYTLCLRECLIKVQNGHSITFSPVFSLYALSYVGCMIMCTQLLCTNAMCGSILEAFSVWFHVWTGAHVVRWEVLRGYSLEYSTGGMDTGAKCTGTKTVCPMPLETLSLTCCVPLQMHYRQFTLWQPHV